MKLTKQGRAELRMKFGGKCAYCGVDLLEKGWHADHVENVDREMAWQVGECGYGGKMVLTGKLLKPENDTLDNLYPACAACNLDKHSMSLESWRGVVAHKVDVCRYDSAFRHAERFGLIAEIQKPVVFWFEQYSRGGTMKTQKLICSVCKTESCAAGILMCEAARTADFELVEIGIPYPEPDLLTREEK